jgi:hypothetical protein
LRRCRIIETVSAEETTNPFFIGKAVKIIFMRKQTVKLLVLFAICFLTGAVTAQSQNLSRPTIITAPCAEKYPLWHKMIYEDNDYLFVYQDYGKAEYIPILLVYGKKRKKWIEIKKISTEHAKLGRFSSSTAKANLQGNRSYSSLKNIKYVHLPLHISGSTDFPDKITYDDNSKTYYFNFNSSSEDAEMLTQFRVLKKDLEQALN